MYECAVDTVPGCPPEKQKGFQERLKAIMDSASHIGWGYGDGFGDLYYKNFSDE